MPSFVFFGTSEFSVYVLDALFAKNCVPKAIVTFPDKPQGRSLVLVPNVVKSWAVAHDIPIVEVRGFKKDPSTIERVTSLDADLFVVASFGRILPDEIIFAPTYKTLNVHPSLLPKLRGPAPIQGAILGEPETGVTIMRLDSKMDEGPIVAQEKVQFDTWPIGYKETEKILGTAGGELLTEVLPKWIDGTLKEIPQNNTEATYTHMIEKHDADISLDDAETAYKKILAYEVWPRARFGDLIITKAHLHDKELVLDRVIPPGKKEMNYSDYSRGRSSVGE